MSIQSACKKVIVFFWLFVFASSVFASPSSPDPSSITAVDPNDKSVEYMRNIFGNVVDVIHGESGPASPDSVIGALSSILNLAVLAITGLVILYVIAVGVLNSAHEGNPLGKMYSSMWVPLRMLFALMLVLPMASGYSVMQIGVIWLAGQGVGIANSVWNAGLDHVAVKGSLYPPTIGVNYERIGKSILESRVCMWGVNAADRHINIQEKPTVKINNQQINGLADANTVSTQTQAANKLWAQRYASAYICRYLATVGK